MASYVNVPNDMSRIKTKILFSLSKRQLICFGAAAVIGIPAYLLTRSAIGNSVAMIVMIVLMLPFFFMAMYECDGLPFEKVARNIIRSRFIRPRVRPYQTENYYAILTKEADQIDQSAKAPAAPAKKRQA